MKKFGDDLDELNNNKTEQIQYVEDKLNNMNTHIEEIDKDIKETREEINNFKTNEEKYMNEIYRIKIILMLFSRMKTIMKALKKIIQVIISLIVKK